MENLDIRRHADGTIDFDFYGRRAILLRRQARRDTLRRWFAFAARTIGGIAASKTGQPRTSLRPSCGALEDLART